MTVAEHWSPAGPTLPKGSALASCWAPRALHPECWWVGGDGAWDQVLHGLLWSWGGAAFLGWVAEASTQG